MKRTHDAIQHKAIDSQHTDATQDTAYTRPVTDDDTWSVNSSYDDVNPIQNTFNSVVFFMLAPIKILVASSITTKEQYEGLFLRVLADEFNRQIALYSQAINSNSTIDWYEERLGLIKQYPELSTESGWLSGKYRELNVTLVDSLINQFGIDKLESVLKDMYAYFDSKVPEAEKTSQLTAHYELDLNDNGAWYPTSKLKVLIKTLPDSYSKLVLWGAKIYLRSTSDIIELINAAPDHITEINISGGFECGHNKEQLMSILAGLRSSKLVLKLKSRDFGIDKLSADELNEVMRIMPPRTYLRINGVPATCCLQSKARALLHNLLPRIETEDFKIPDTVLDALLKDEIRLRNIVNRQREFVRHIEARKLVHEVQDRIKRREFVFNDLVVPKYAMDSDSGAKELVNILAYLRTSFSYLCGAMLLSGELKCYWDNGEDIDAQRQTELYASAVDYYRFATADIILKRAASRHFVSCSKYDLQLQESSGSSRYKNFLQHVFNTDNYLATARALIWRNPDRCEDYLREAAAPNPIRIKPHIL